MELLETKQRFIELRAQGWSFDKIAKELGKAKQTLIDWSKELSEEIANSRALELEALYEKHYLLKENRLQIFGELLAKMRGEILNRDLSDLSTDKLLDLYLKYSNQAKEEIVEPTYRSSEELQEDSLDKELLKELTSPAPNSLRKLKTA